MKNINKPTTKNRLRPCLICGYEQAKGSILEHTMTHIKNYDKYNLTENNYKFLVDILNLKMYKCKSCKYICVLKQNINEHEHKHDNLSEIEYIPDEDFIKTHKKIPLTSKELKRQNEFKLKKPTKSLKISPSTTKKRKRDNVSDPLVPQEKKIADVLDVREEVKESILSKPLDFLTGLFDFNRLLPDKGKSSKSNKRKSNKRKSFNKKKKSKKSFNKNI